jgi:hypothetical protein
MDGAQPRDRQRVDERDTILARMARRAPRTHRMGRWLDDMISGREWNPTQGDGVKEEG